MSKAKGWTAVGIRKDLMRRLSEAAEADGRSASNYLERLLEACLRSEAKP